MSAHPPNPATVAAVLVVLGRALVAAAAALAVLAGPLLFGAAPPVATSAVPRCEAAWRHPVEAPIVDRFRPPSDPYGSGNRGIEYGTTAGDRVVAVADGSVSFAGPVGGIGFVVIQHGPALWATYGYLQTFDVAVGDKVAAESVLATADAGFHLTARRAETPGGPRRYVDPLPLLASACFTVKLVPLPSDDELIPVYAG